MPAFLARRYVAGADVECLDGAPVAFVWRGRRHRVRAVLDHWWETAAWWMQPQETLGDDEREMWRVEAVPAGRAPVVVELCFAWRSARWTVDAVMD
jgi:hypothetical protein